MGWTATAEHQAVRRWMVRCTEIPELMTLATRLRDAPEAIAAEITRHTGTTTTGAEVTVQAIIPPVALEAMLTAEHLRDQEKEIRAAAARQTRLAALELTRHMSNEDASVIMGVNKTRITQYLKEASAAGLTLSVDPNRPERVEASRAQVVPDPEPTAAPHVPAQTATEAVSRDVKIHPRAVAVVDLDRTYTPDGQVHPTPVIRHLGDLAQIGYDLGLGVEVVARGGRVRPRTDAGVVLVTAQVAAQLGIQLDGLPRDGASRAREFADAHGNHASILDAQAAGWQTAEQICADLRAWNRMWKPGADSVYVTFVDMLPPVVRSNAELGDIAQRLGTYAGLLGTNLHLSASTTGIDLMPALRAKFKEEFALAIVPPPAKAIGDPDITAGWSRTPTTEEEKLTYVHAYDRGGSHLAGVAGLELPIGNPVHYQDGLPFDPKLPGYWRVQIPDAADWRFPHPIYLPRYGESNWVTTPTLAFAAELGYDLEPTEAYVWPAHARVMDPWYRRVAEARTATDSATDPNLLAVRQLIKDTYTRTFGMMGSKVNSEGKWYYLPAHRHHLIAKARANLLRRVVQIGTDTGIWPLAVKTDTLLYASDNPDPVTAWPGKPDQLGLRLGQYKPEGTGLLVNQIPHLGGNSAVWTDDAKRLVTGRDRGPGGDE